MTRLFFLFSFNEEGIEGLPCPCGINAISFSVDANAFPCHVFFFLFSFFFGDLVAGRGEGRPARCALLATREDPNASFIHTAHRERAPTFTLNDQRPSVLRVPPATGLNDALDHLQSAIMSQSSASSFPPYHYKAPTNSISRVTLCSPREPSQLFSINWILSPQLRSWPKRQARKKKQDRFRFPSVGLH